MDTVLREFKFSFQLIHFYSYYALCFLFNFRLPVPYDTFTNVENSQMLGKSVVLSAGFGKPRNTLLGELATVILLTNCWKQR